MAQELRHLVREKVFALNGIDPILMGFNLISERPQLDSDPPKLEAMARAGRAASRKTARNWCGFGRSGTGIKKRFWRPFTTSTGVSPSMMIVPSVGEHAGDAGSLFL